MGGAETATPPILLPWSSSIDCYNKKRCSSIYCILCIISCYAVVADEIQKVKTSILTAFYNVVAVGDQ